MKITIIGGGNIGTLLLGDLSTYRGVTLQLLTSKPEQWSHDIDVYDQGGKLEYSGHIDRISDRPEEIISNADLIISTVPSHIFPQIMEKIKAYIRPGTWLGVMPGSGGCEFICQDLLAKGCILFGFQRVHGIARIKEYGKSVYDLGKKKKLFIAAIPSHKTEDICAVLGDLLKIECRVLPNYLNVTLTPSNPILHTTRLYSMFHDYREGIYWEEPIGFYDEWTDEASRLLLACDQELQTLCGELKGLDLSGVRSLRQHYEAATPEQMTAKIRSIKAFKGIKTPMIKTESGYLPDYGSRYFLEDFPYGLCIIKSFAEVLKLKTPSIDQILHWYERIAGVCYYQGEHFNGRDTKSLPLPQNYGLNSLAAIISYYTV